jgi:hypothetical protein
VAWTGTEEPQLSLPYQRKCDFERHGRGDERLRLAYEALQVSLDLLSVLRERLTDLDVSDSAFSWPEVSDIQTERAQLGLGLGIDEVLASGGLFRAAVGRAAPKAR